MTLQRKEEMTATEAQLRALKKARAKRAANLAAEKKPTRGVKKGKTPTKKQTERRRKEVWVAALDKATHGITVPPTAIIAIEDAYQAGVPAEVAAELIQAGVVSRQ